MPASKTLDPAVKQAFAAAGVKLTPAQEHVAAGQTAVDWKALIANFGALAVKLIPIIIAFLGGATPPAKAAAPGCCDHHGCCLKTFESAAETLRLAGEHLTECACE